MQTYYLQRDGYPINAFGPIEHITIEAPEELPLYEVEEIYPCPAYVNGGYAYPDYQHYLYCIGGIEIS